MTNINPVRRQQLVIGWCDVFKMWCQKYYPIKEYQRQISTNYPINAYL